MNILIINHYAGSPNHGMEFRPYYMAREWVKSNHRVKIVAASFSHIRSEQPRLDGKTLDETVNDIDYRWYATPPYSGNGVSRVRNMLRFLWALWRDAPRLAHEFKPDVVIASSTYPMDIWPAKKIAVRAGARLVYEVHDLWPLSPMELGGMSKWHPFIMWVQLAEDYAYRNAFKVVSMLPKTKEYMCSRGMESTKFVYVPNGIVEQDWAMPAGLPADVEAFLSSLRDKGLPIVGYTGTLGLANDIGALLDASKQLKEKAQVVLVGKGPDRDKLQNRVEEEGLTNVYMLPPVSKLAIPALLSQLDIAYIGGRSSPLYRFGISPNKLMDYMMASKPIVMAIEAGDDPVRKAGCGISVRPGDAIAISQAIMRLLDMPRSERDSMGVAGRKHILENQTYRILAKRFLLSMGPNCA